MFFIISLDSICYSNVCLYSFNNQTKMSNMKIIFISSLFLYLFHEARFANQQEPSSGQLVSVYVLMRHGDRTPTQFYINDPLQDEKKFWPEGIGNLNDHGKQRIKMAGNIYKRIYGKFLNETFGWPKFIFSSPRNRTIETASLFMKYFLDNLLINFQILIDDKMLSISSKCVRSEQIWLDHISKNSTINKYIESKTNFIKYLETKTGEHYLELKPYVLRKMEFLATTLEIERDEYGYSVPEWAKNQSTIDNLNDLKQKAFWFDWQLPTIQKLRIGLLLNNITNYIRSFGQPSNEARQRIFIYSAHDVNIVLLLQALNMYNQIDLKPPSYCSAIVIEHYQKQDDNREDQIRIIYRQILNSNNNNNDNYIHLDINLTFNHSRGETQFCSLSQFEKIIQPFIIGDNEQWHKKCSNSAATISMQTMSIILSLFIFFSHNE